jgi:transcription elongation factor Elf1
VFAKKGDLSCAHALVKRSKRYNLGEGITKEAADMEFSITCPVDGPITVSLEDIDSVVLRESEQADVTFVCPHCGSEISVTGVVPGLLLDAIHAIADEAKRSAGRSSGMHQRVDREQRTLSKRRSEVIDAYCEYFRRQLARVESADDAVSEIEARIN